MTTKNFMPISIIMVLFALWAAGSSGQEATIQSPQPELESVLVMTVTDFNTQFGQSGSGAWITMSNGWTVYNVMHLNRTKLKAEWATSRPSEKIHVFQCGATAEVQQQTASELAPYADLYSYWAFLCTSSDKPVENELFWGELDNPFVNQVRQMRKAAGTTPIIAHLRADFGGAKASRPAILEEMQWQFIAVTGCGYRGALWPMSYRDVAWGNDLKQIDDAFKKYAHFLAQAQPVNWVKTSKNSVISTLACDGYLFVFLLNPAYMKLDVDGKTVTVPLEKSLCEGTVTFELPDGIKVHRGQTLLGGEPLRLTSQDNKTTTQFSFKTGGEMMIFVLSGKAELILTTQPATKPATTRLADTETIQ